MRSNEFGIVNPYVVEKEQVADAIAQNQATIGIASLIGPILSGLLYTANHVFPFLADAISYCASVISLLFIRVPFQDRPQTQSRALHVEIAEGLSWLWNNALIRWMTILAGGVNLVLPGSTLIVIVQAQRVHTSTTFIGLIFGMVGVGAIIGSFLAPMVQRRYRFGTIMVSLMWLFLLLWLFFLVSPNPFVMGTVLSLLVLLGPIYNVVLISYRLALTPDRLQGRVNSVARMISLGAIPINYIVTGTLLQLVGVEWTLLIFAAVVLGLALMVTFNTHIRGAVALSEVLKSA